MRILIPTFPQDVHAVEVALALEDRGHEAVQWFGSDFPTAQTATIQMDGEVPDWQVGSPGTELEFAL